MKKGLFLFSICLFVLSGCLYKVEQPPKVDIVISFTNEGDSLDKVTGDLILPSEYKEESITWQSSNESILSNDGILLVDKIEEDIPIMMTATLSSGEKIKFLLTIKANVNDEEDTDVLAVEVKAFLNVLNSITEVDLGSRNQIELARTLFDRLDSTKKRQVSGKDYLRLVTIESTYNSLLVNQAAVEVCNMISSIIDGSLTNEQAILNARSSYNNLNDDLKKEVNNHDRLLALEVELQSNKDIAFVEEKIREIGPVDMNSEIKINIALAFYNHLSETEKAKVSNKDVLSNAVSAYQNLITEFRVVFLDSDETVLKIESVKTNQSATPPVVDKIGYTFIAWSSNEYQNVTKDVTVKASYSLTTYDIVYNLNGGVLSNSVNSYTVLDEVNLKTPTKTNHIFLGWYTESSFTHKVTSISVNSIGNKTFYAKWVSLTEEFNITYNLNGGYWGFLSKAELTSSFFNDLKTYLGASETYNTFVHGVGKTSGFAGLWYTDARYKDKIYKVNSKLPNSDPYFINHPTYNAKWLAFFNLIDEMVKQVNSTQSFWGEVYVED